MIKFAQELIMFGASTSSQGKTFKNLMMRFVKIDNICFKFLSY